MRFCPLRVSRASDTVQAVIRGDDGMVFRCKNWTQVGQSLARGIGHLGGIARHRFCMAHGVKGRFREVAFACGQAFAIDPPHDLAFSIVEEIRINVVLVWQNGAHLCHRVAKGIGARVSVGNILHQLTCRIVSVLDDKAFSVDRRQQFAVGIVEVAAVAILAQVDYRIDLARLQGIGQGGNIDRIGIPDHLGQASCTVIPVFGYVACRVHRFRQAVGTVVGIPVHLVARFNRRKQGGQTDRGRLALPISEARKLVCREHARVADGFAELPIEVVDVFCQAAVAVDIGDLAPGFVIQVIIFHAGRVGDHAQPAIGIVLVGTAAQIGTTATLPNAQ